MIIVIGFNAVTSNNFNYSVQGMSINGMFQSSKFKTKISTNKKSITSSFSDLYKGDPSFEETSSPKKGRLDYSGDINKSMESPAPKYSKGLSYDSRYRGEEDDEYSNTGGNFISDTSMLVDRDFKTKPSFGKKGKPQGFGLTDSMNNLIDDLHAQTSNQLQRINQLIDSLGKKLSKQIKQQFKKFKEVIIDTIDMVFKESSDIFNRIIQKQQAKLQEQIEQNRQILESIYSGLEKLKNNPKITKKTIQQEIRQKNYEQELESVVNKINQLENEPPNINFVLNKKRINTYNEALAGLLQFDEPGGKVKKGY